MKSIPTTSGALLTFAVAAMLLTASDLMPAQTMTTKKTSGMRINAQYVCRLKLPGAVQLEESTKSFNQRMSTSTQSMEADLVVNAEVAWVIQRPGAEPKVTYKIQVGLQNTGVGNWKTIVKFKLSDRRQTWDSQEPLNVPLLSPPLAAASHVPHPATPIRIQLTPPAQGVLPGATAMASTVVQHTVEWRKRPGWEVDAFDGMGNWLGACSIDDMKAVSTVFGPARDAEVLRNQPGIGIEDPEAASRPKPGPNWGTLKSPQ